MPVPPTFGTYASGFAVFTTWNPGDHSSQIALTGSNLIATCSSTPPNTAGVRSTTSRSSGKLHLEFTINAISGIGAAWPLYGLANASLNMSNNTAGTTRDSIEAQRNGVTFFNNVNLGAIDTYVAGNTIALEVDFGTLQVWFQKLGGTGRKGPFSIASAITPYFIYTESNGVGSQVVLNVGATSFAISPTAGFSAWG